MIRKQFQLISSVSMLKIIAPISHFTLNEKFKRLDKSIFKIKDNVICYDISEIKLELQRLKEAEDPIACLKVEGGYIILHAWDKEAEIPEIKNSSLN